MAKIVCFGEIMLRLNPEGYLRIRQANSFCASYAGGEANVAVSLANYGHDASFVSVVPDNALGESAANALRHWGVDCSHMYRGGDRLGIYFVEKGASQRPSTVIYDRKDSAIATSTREMYDWPLILKGADWFHFTGITPALAPELVEITLEACKTAKEMGIMVSCDLNYRKKLWSRSEAQAAMSRLVPYVDVLIANEEDAFDVFSIEATGSDVATGIVDGAHYEEVAKEIVDRFGCKYVAITLRASISANDNNWGGLLYDGERSWRSTTYPIHIVDRVGGGDSFGGALIHAMLAKWEPQKAIGFAAAASCLKQTIEYDFNQVSVEEVERLMAGDATGRVRR